MSLAYRYYFILESPIPKIKHKIIIIHVVTFMHKEIIIIIVNIHLNHRKYCNNSCHIVISVGNRYMPNITRSDPLLNKIRRINLPGAVEIHIFSSFSYSISFISTI